MKKFISTPVLVSTNPQNGNAVCIREANGNVLLQLEGIGVAVGIDRASIIARATSIASLINADAKAAEDTEKVMSAAMRQEADEVPLQLKALTDWVTAQGGTVSIRKVDSIESLRTELQESISTLSAKVDAMAGENPDLEVVRELNVADRDTVAVLTAYLISGGHRSDYDEDGDGSFSMTVCECGTEALVQRFGRGVLEPGFSTVWAKAPSKPH